MIQKKRFSLVTFLLSLLTKESNSAACGRKLLILPLASKALELQSFEAFKAASRIKSVPPLKRRVTFFCLKQQKKGNQRKMLFCESSARKLGASAGMRHTGHPCPGGARRASCTPPFGCAFANASYKPRSAG
ncbi:hypothetical protein IEQ11_09305 [Lysobacter capsici]|uniref:hypothetical protein n=1 Tax=Lysobacter capsici TaxID=435897 RepID=UPI001FF391B1|nr:hypothetical protein [Lysobacter capsici]UOF16805.1 hypothetical protein IEQ11_09305 [Lysobacter capsici]